MDDDTVGSRAEWQVIVRPASVEDAERLARLLADYLTESFPGHPGTDAPTLRREVLSGARGVRVLLAQANEQVVGFVTWHSVYDIHWGKGGAEVGDLYVAPRRRGIGIALALLAAVCAAARRDGMTYLRGTSFDRVSAVGRFYERIAVAHDSAECHCAGRAFRQLADLAGQPPRAIVHGLPPVEWNHEP